MYKFNAWTQENGSCEGIDLLWCITPPGMSVIGAYENDLVVFQGTIPFPVGQYMFYGSEQIKPIAEAIFNNVVWFDEIEFSWEEVE